MPDPTTIFTFDEKTAREIAKFIASRRGQPPNIRASHVAGKKAVTQFLAVKVTSVGSVGSVATHAWTEQQWDATQGKWVDAPDPVLGYTDTNYLINQPDATAALDVGTVYIAMRFDDFSAHSGTGETLWVKVGSGGALPSGQYPWMVYLMGSNNQPTFDFPRAHGLL